MKPLIIIKIGDTSSELAAEFGDYENWINEGFGELNIPVHVIDPRHGDPLPSVDTIAGAVISGSDSMVTDREPWSEELAAWLIKLIPLNTPVLGICYGHQLLAHAMGGTIGFHPEGMELGTVDIRQTELAASDLLFKDLPAQFPAQVVHSQSVLRLPQNAVLLASNLFEAHHAFRVGECAWGVQFHPEFSAEVMQKYVGQLSMTLKEGAQAELKAREVTHSNHAATLLQKFGAIVKNRQSILSQRGTPERLGASK